MINIEGIVLHKLLKEKSLDAFAELKTCFFHGAYSPLYRNINKFYLKEGSVPSFDELKLVTKNVGDHNALLALEMLEVPDVDIELAVSALIDEYAQDEALTAIDKFVDSITYLDVGEIKEGIGEILLDLDRKLNTDETIMSLDQFLVFEESDALDALKVPIGISNWYDSNVGGLYLEELLLLGGKRGSGKSLLCANIVAANYEAGGVSVYYTIEMSGRETFMRIMCILAKVEFKKYRKNLLELDDIDKLAKVRCEMFVGAEEVYEEFKTHRDRFKLEKELLRSYSLKPDNQIIIVDDRSLSVTQIDLSLQKLKTQFGDKLSVAVVDYVNQVTLGGSSEDLFDWKDQVSVSKQLKNLARKHLVAMISPYQIDENGATRFAKGILDACDVALLLDAKKYPGSLLYECTKARSDSDTFKFRTNINWETLRIDPSEIEATPPQEPSDDDEDEAMPKVNRTYDNRADKGREDGI